MNLRANPDDLERTALLIKNELVPSYLNDVKGIMGIIDELRNAWQGKENQAFSQAVYNHKPTLDSLGNVAGQYADFILTSVGNMRNIQSEIASPAGNLNG